jgi:hypothetical protein
MMVIIYPFEETKLVDYPLRKMLWRCVRSKLHKEQKNFEDVLESAFVNQFTDFQETLYEQLSIWGYRKSLLSDALPLPVTIW